MAQVNRQPLRIGISVSRFPVWSETFIVTKVLGLIDRGFDITIFADHPSDQWDRFGILNDRHDVRSRVKIAPSVRGRNALSRGLVKVLGIMLRHPLSFVRFAGHCWAHRKRNPLGFLKALYLRAHFVGHKLDILHIEFDTQGISVVDLKEYLGCKLLLSSRVSFQQTSLIDLYPDAAKTIYSFADGYHFISLFVKDNTFMLGLNPATRWWLIQPAIDLSLFTPREPTSPQAEESAKPYTKANPLRLLSVGRLGWQKGYEFAIDAIAKVKAAGIEIEYTILGEGPYREAIEFAANHYGLLKDGTVKLPGAIPREEVSRYLQEADIMIHSALEEGFANAVIEAQASELPVVTSDAGGLPENVEDGVTGFVVPRRDADAMAEKIILLARDPALRQQMGKAGRQRALEKFDIRGQVAAFEKLYHELAGW